MNYLKNLRDLFTRIVTLAFIGAMGIFFSCKAANPPYTVKHLGDGQSIVQVDQPKKYMLLPIEETSGESRLFVIVDNDVVQTLHVRLAVTKTDYYVPLDLSAYSDKHVALNFHHIADDALCWTELKLSDEFDTSNRETFRPAYHFSPLYGWMNDPNGMVYKDGEYHLFYQHNPYGSMWGNMHWGHAISRDLIHWEHLPDAISPDGLGTIFSGSAVVDKDNTSGFGAGAIVAFYTSAGERQTQSLAYSLDNGRTFKKYERNPILTSTVRDFRDPKVFWHEQTGKWILILAAGQEMQIYSSANLKDWTMESRFGEGHGAHGGVWECPDLIELPIEGTELKKWVLICNLNPGGPFGGSATQYFVGTFDGKTFVNESQPGSGTLPPGCSASLPGRMETGLPASGWMDWGRDHYATVTWSNAPDNRSIAIAWMSNWDYANDVPTKQFRAANSIPRDLSLYTYNGETYLKSSPSPEMLALRGKAQKKGSFKVDRTYNLDKVLADNAGTYEIEMEITNRDAEIIGFQLFNTKGEEIDCYYNLTEGKFFMDRTKSGIVSFSDKFPSITAAPIEKGKNFKLRLFIDKASVEAFGEDGRFAMTNLVFPTEPYNRISFYAKGGTYNVTSLVVYSLIQ